MSNNSATGRAGRLRLDVIGAGMPRSGTLSCQLALQKLLGGPCYHMLEALKNGELHVWADQTPGQPLTDEAVAVLQPYSACIDFPCMLHWQQLLELNPQGKVLLTIRDSFDTWYESIYQTVYHKYRIECAMPWYAPLLDPQIKISVRAHHQFFGPDGLFQGRFQDREFARQVYERHMQDIISKVPKDRLLVFNVKEGWAPLCAFLGLPVPAEPFPRVNESSSFQTTFLNKHRRQLRFMRYGVPALAAGITTVVASAALQLLKRR